MMGETIIPDSISNPIRTGFHPDPSICRVGEDYYLVTSSFTWFPGLPIYHSRDLTNRSLIGHALTNPKAIDFNGMTDNDGIWAPTLRYHNGTFYFIHIFGGGGGAFHPSRPLFVARGFGWAGAAPLFPFFFSDF